MGTLAPKRLRYHLDDAKLQNAVLHSLLHGIEQGLRESLPETDGATHINPHLGAVVFIPTSAVCSMPTCIFMC